MEDVTIYVPLSNYYGRLHIKRIDGKHFMCLDDFDGDKKLEISEELFLALEKEFE